MSKAFETKMSKMIAEISNLERPECYVYLKSGVSLWLKGKMKLFSEYFMVKDIREVTIVRYSEIAGFRILNEVIPKEENDVEENKGEVK